MPSPGEGWVSDRASVGPLRVLRRGADLLHEARQQERAGCIPEAIARFGSAIAAAEQAGEHTVLAEALRRLAILRHHGNESGQARALCRRSYEVARQIGNELLAAEALNTLGGLHLAAGTVEEARQTFLEALELGGARRGPRARVGQKLGSFPDNQGGVPQAIPPHQRSPQADRGPGGGRGV